MIDLLQDFAFTYTVCTGLRQHCDVCYGAYIAHKPAQCDINRVRLMSTGIRYRPDLNDATVLYPAQQASYIVVPSAVAALLLTVLHRSVPVAITPVHSETSGYTKVAVFEQVPDIIPTGSHSTLHSSNSTRTIATLQASRATEQLQCNHHEQSITLQSVPKSPTGRLQNGAECCSYTVSDERRYRATLSRHCSDGGGDFS
jgi:hypothetical protein